MRVINFYAFAYGLLRETGLRDPQVGMMCAGSVFGKEALRTLIVDGVAGSLVQLLMAWFKFR